MSYISYNVTEYTLVPTLNATQKNNLVANELG